MRHNEMRTHSRAGLVAVIATVVAFIGPTLVGAQTPKVGQFILSGGGLADQSGWFSTVWEHRPEGWRVIHDHSS